VSRLRNDFFRLKPADDGHRSSGGENLLEKMDLSNMFYDSSPGGAKMFRLSFDVSQFRPEEINITTHDQRLIVHAKHEGKSTPRRTSCSFLCVRPSPTVGGARGILFYGRPSVRLWLRNRGGMVFSFPSPPCLLSPPLPPLSSLSLPSFPPFSPLPFLPFSTLFLPSLRS